MSRGPPDTELRAATRLRCRVYTLLIACRSRGRATSPPPSEIACDARSQRSKPMGKFDRYAFSAQPSFDEAGTRKGFSKAVPLKTLVIYCFDPRAAEIPNAVAKLFGDEVFPGDIILDGSGNRVASTTTIFPVIVAGGRAVDALRSITVAQHLFGIQNIVVVHHSHCGGTSF